MKEDTRENLHTSWFYLNDMLEKLTFCYRKQIPGCLSEESCGGSSWLPFLKEWNSSLSCWEFKLISLKELSNLPYSILKITADGDCSHEIKKSSLLGRKAMTNLDSTLKSRGFTLLTKVHLVKAMIFPVVMYEC